MLELIRSPAGVTWQVVCNGQTIITRVRKWEAIRDGQSLSKKYGMGFKS